MWAKQALNAQAIGDGPDILVMIHGFGSDQTVWASYLPWLSQHFRVITYDLPCSGSADPEFFDLTRHGVIEGHAQDLIDILRSFEAKRCSVVGHSLGGLIGAFAAIEVPECFDQLILIAAAPRYLDGPGFKGGFDAPGFENLFAAAAANFREWASSFAPVVAGALPGDPATQTFLASLLRSRPDITIAMMKSILLGDYREHLKQCRTRAALLQTEDDPAVPLEAAQALQECLRGSTLEIINTKGHLPHLTAPKAIADAFRRHLPQLSKPALSPALS